MVRLLIASQCSICAVTAYRIQVSASIGDPRSPKTQEAYSVIALLTSLETLLGIISACMPMMKPIVKKLYDVFPKRGADTPVTATSGSIPIMMRISQMFSTSSKKYSSSKHRTSLDPSWDEELSDEKHGRRAPPEPKADRVLGIKAADIHVRRDVDIESFVREE